MIHYSLTLINKDRNLDLTQKRVDIEQVFRYIDNGGATGHRFKDLDRYEALQIRKDQIEVDVQESGKSWHRRVGRILANKYRMRKYCHEKNKHQMFRWN